MKKKETNKYFPVYVGLIFGIAMICPASLWAPYLSNMYSGLEFIAIGMPLTSIVASIVAAISISNEHIENNNFDNNHQTEESQNVDEVSVEETVNKNTHSLEIKTLKEANQEVSDEYLEISSILFNDESNTNTNNSYEVTNEYDSILDMVENPNFYSNKVKKKTRL